jgi:RNA polymerase primary sigma factor
MEQVMQHLAAELGRAPTEDEIAESFGMTTSEYRDKAAQGESAKERMVKSNLRLVVSVAKAYQGRGLDLPDLVQVGQKRERKV